MITKRRRSRRALRVQRCRNRLRQDPVIASPWPSCRPCHHRALITSAGEAIYAVELAALSTTMQTAPRRPDGTPRQPWLADVAVYDSLLADPAQCRLSEVR